MNRTGFLIALAIAVVVGLVFALYPKLDLHISALFYEPGPLGFWSRTDPVSLRLRDLGRLVDTALIAPAILALVLKLVVPRRPMLIPGRAAVLLISTLALGPGIITNTILKDHWGRPRPLDVVQFGGDQQFLPWWDPRGTCEDNCSFVAGEPAGAFWTLAPAMLVPPPWRVVAAGAAVVFGLGIGLVRIWNGGHFFTDVVFSGVITFLVIWVVHGLLYRWPATAVSDRMVERLLERLAPATWLAGRRGPPSAPDGAGRPAEKGG